MMTLDEAMEAYREEFGDQYPLYCALGMSKAEVVADIERCLHEGKPFEYKPGADY